MNDDYTIAKRYALKRLSSQSLHSAQLRKILHEKQVSDDIINQIIVEFQRLGFLNDPEWIQSYIRGHSKRHGPRSILAKLRLKGIAREEVEETLHSMSDSDTQKESILNLLKTRYKSRDLSDYKEKQKVIASLMRKGFDFDAIQNAFLEKYK